MVVGAARDEPQALVGHRLPHRVRVDDDLLDVGLEFGLHRLSEGDRLGSDDVLERAALQAGEDRLVQRRCPLLGAQHETRTRAPQRLVAGRADEVGVWHRAGVRARGDEPGDVRHVDHQHSAHTLRYGREALEVDHPRVRRRSGDDHPRLVLAGEALELVVVDELRIHVQPVRHHVEPLA